MKSPAIAKIVFALLCLFTLTPWVSSGIALLLGIVFATTLDNPFASKLTKIIQNLLLVAITGLGAGMNLKIIAQVGMHGLAYTIIGITLTIALGTFLGKLLRVQENCSLLITVGTAICGGSAIAAFSPLIKAKPQELSVALGTVFMLNAAALFLFPWIGHHLFLSEAQFGLWSALAIHDTSSVVGATLSYGHHALEIGTTVKLARAMWIMPLCLLMASVQAKRNKQVGGKAKVKFPWYILGFITTAAIVTWIPSLAEAGHELDHVAKKLMVFTLFLIGSSLNRATIKSVGVMPFLQGIGLWIIVACSSLSAIYFGVIN